jgi:hypothetical protein
VTVHGIVIAFLLLFPWVLTGIGFVGAASSAAKRGLNDLQKAWRVRRGGESVFSLPQGRRREHPASSRTVGHSNVPQQSATMRKAA